MNARAWIAAVVIACATPCVHAETFYVVEQLVVSVNAAPDGTGDRVGQIKSGDRVEVLEREGDQAHVQLASGQEGWIKGSYLTADPPMREQLTSRTAELEKVRKEKAQLETDLTAARAAVTTANANAAKATAAASKAANGPVAEAPMARPAPATASPVEPPAPAATPEPTSQGAPPLFEDKPMMPSRPSWLAASLTALVTLAAGFALGWRMLDRRIRAKYGGLRIY